MSEAWVAEMCRRWARAKLRIRRGGDGKGHVDGWPPSSIAGRIREEGEGLGQGAIRQHYAEVMTGEALLVARAVDRMNFEQRGVLDKHYCEGGSAGRKAKKLGVSIGCYWDHLRQAHSRIAGFIEGMEYADGVAKIPEKVDER